MEKLIHGCPSFLFSVDNCKRDGLSPLQGKCFRPLQGLNEDLRV
jgi:hypothetical protein